MKPAPSFITPASALGTTLLVESVVITSTGQVYVGNKQGQLSKLRVSFGQIEAAASWSKFGQSLVFSVPDNVATFMNALIDRWFEEMPSGDTSNVTKKYLVAGEYPPQIKVNYTGSIVERGELVDLIVNVKCYVYRRGGASDTLCGVVFKPDGGSLTL
jgi:hypothetical protein